jgi:hypothetical protein
LTNGLFLQKEIAPPIKGEALLNICTIIYPSANSKRLVIFLKNTQIRPYLHKKNDDSFSKALRRATIINMQNHSEPCLNANIVTWLAMDHYIFDVEFHTILQRFELCLPCLHQILGKILESCVLD